MRRFLLLFAIIHLFGFGIVLLISSCGEGQQEKLESNPKEEPSLKTKAEPKMEPARESRKLPPLPKTVTAEFIMDLWARPHEGTGVMEELEDYALKPGVWPKFRR